MREYKRIFVLCVLSFAAFTLASSKMEASFDGNNSFGFPFIFFVQHGGKCESCPSTMDWTYLIIDLIFSFFGGLIIWQIRRKLKKSVLKNKHVG